MSAQSFQIRRTIAACLALCLATAGVARAAPEVDAAGYRIQLGAFSSRAAATDAWQRLRAAHGDLLGALEPVFEPVARDGQPPLFRLQAGPFARDAAQGLCRALAERDQDCLAVARPSDAAAPAQPLEPKSARSAATGPVASAAPVSGAITAFNEGRVEAAAAMFRPLAEQGDAVAQNFMGLMHAHGRGLDKDPEAAARWYRKAAEQGYGAAEHNLGDAYEHGEGVERDPVAAARWYRAAAKQDIASAQNALAALHYHGTGVDRNWREAAYWYRKAADSGYAESQHNLAVLYFKGEGVPRDIGEAYFWWSVAAGTAPEGDPLGLEAAEQARRLETYLTAAERADAQARVAEWLDANR
jgi:TPR repeat protein